MYYSEEQRETEKNREKQIREMKMNMVVVMLFVYNTCFNVVIEKMGLVQKGI